MMHCVQELKKMWFCNLMVTDKAEQNKGHATFVMDQLTAKVRGQAASNLLSDLISAG